MSRLLFKTFLIFLTVFFMCEVLTYKKVFAGDVDNTLMVMEEELSRSMKDLKLEVYGPPYFLSYQIKGFEIYELGGDFGAIYKDNRMKHNNLFIEARFGTFKTDNTDVGTMTRFRHFRLPVEYNEDSLRRNIWTATDGVYKAAITGYLRKQGKDIQKIDIDKLADFSEGEKSIYIEKQSEEFNINLATWRNIIRDASAYFKEFKDVLKSKVDLTVKKTNRYYVNSEGSRIKDFETVMSININAWGQASDGMWLSDMEIFHVKDVSKLPSLDEIKSKIKDIASTITALIKSEKINPYIGPAIFAPDAAGVLFHEAIGHRLEGERQRNEKEGKTFKDKIGKSIVPDFINLFDDPTLADYDGEILFGNYKYDDEGQKAKRASLIEKGVLKNFLMSRTPVKGFNKTNGHGRGDNFKDPIARMANLIVSSENGYSFDGLKGKLIKEAKRQGKEYGLIIKKVGGGETNTSRYSFQAFKGTPTVIYKVFVDDGRIEMVRGAEFVGTPLSSISRIMAIGNDYTVFNGFCGAESGFIPVSTVSPSILLSEIELQRKPFNSAKLTILDPPAIKH